MGVDHNAAWRSAMVEGTFAYPGEGGGEEEEGKDSRHKWGGGGKAVRVRGREKRKGNSFPLPATYNSSRHP